VGESGTYVTTDKIANTDDDELYQSERYGMAAYQFDVPSGSYSVNLYFAEIFFTAGGKRKMDVYIEEQIVLENLDVHKMVKHDVALVYSYPDVAVVDGQLNIDFIPHREKAKISAIAVLSPDQGMAFATARKTEVIDESILPKKYYLHQNYPNPFNAWTTIRYELPYTSDVSVKIFNILGDMVVELEDKLKIGGLYTVRWDGKNSRGEYLTSGTYLYQLVAQPVSNEQPAIRITKKMVYCP
jgi:hypothetical protein